jgi:hypothetical protein
LLVALDFFTVPTITFQLLYCFFVIDHQRRKILHCNVTAHPTGNWVIQQLRETFSGEEPYRYVILDHDAKFNGEMIAFLKSTGLKPKRTSVQARWQNGIAERSIPLPGSILSFANRSGRSGERNGPMNNRSGGGASGRSQHWQRDIGQ